MRQGKKFITILASILLAVMPLPELSAANLSEAQKEKAALEAELKEAQALIDEMKNSKENMESRVRRLDSRLTEISGRILTLESRMEKKNVQIEDTKEQLKEASADAQAQYERMKYRIKYMYENSASMSVLDALLTSGSMAEFINQAEYIRQITSYDRKMLEKYKETQQTVADAKSSLESDYDQLEELKVQVQEEQKAVGLLLAAKEEELSGIEGNLNAAEANADVMAAEIQAQNDIIAQIQAEEARKEAARKAAEEKAKQEAEQQGNTEQPSEGEENGGSSQEAPPDDAYHGGAFAWPCPSSTRVTSDYGSRLSPTAGASSNHKGIDIGADYGATIVAAADGTVSFAGYNSGMGNYIMISHGSGLYTVYGHCSALLVSTGDTVTAGQSIAQVGSTGISTGNHLHFGVSKDGAYVSPWDYLGG